MPSEVDAKIAVPGRDRDASPPGQGSSQTVVLMRVFWREGAAGTRPGNAMGMRAGLRQQGQDGGRGSRVGLR
jgi:hypothetical protein